MTLTADQKDALTELVNIAFSRTAAALSDLWDKGLVKRLRAGDGALILPGRRVSLHLMAQPDVAAIMLFDPLLREQGMLSRLLVTAPDSTAGTRLWREPKPESGQALARYRNKLLGILRSKPPMAVDEIGRPTPNELAPRALPLAEPRVAGVGNLCVVCSTWPGVILWCASKVRT